MKHYEPILFVGLGGSGCDIGAELESQLRAEICVLIIDCSSSMAIPDELPLAPCPEAASPPFVLVNSLPRIDPVVASGHTRPEKPSQHWQPTLTSKEAARLGIPKDEYQSAVVYACMAVGEHQGLGTSCDRWEPTLIHNDHLTAPYVTDSGRELASRLRDIQPIAAAESGFKCPLAQAIERAEQPDMKIEQTEVAGKHHRRANGLLQRHAILVPWVVEAAGFLTFVGYYLNLPLLQPWRDWLGWGLAVTVVVGIIVGQTWLVRHIARSHDHAREARAARNGREAERGFTRRNRYIGLTAVTAVAITSGVIWRGTAALGDASVGTTAVTVFVAAVTGLFLLNPTCLGTPLDGPKISRERDNLAANLDDSLKAYLETIDSSRRDLAKVVETGPILTKKTFPDICNTALEAGHAFYRFYGIICLLVGGLAANMALSRNRASTARAHPTGRGVGLGLPLLQVIRLTRLGAFPLMEAYAFALLTVISTELSAIGSAELQEAVRHDRHYELHQIMSGRN